MKIVGNIIKWVGFGAYVACAVLIVMFLTPIGSWKALDVLTGSMKPAIQPGDLVLIHRVPLASIRPGNVVTYVNPHNPKETITHRVTNVTQVKGITTITVKGDANPVADPPFAGGQIRGRVAAIVPGAGRILSVFHSAYGLALLVIIPALLVIWAEARRLQRVLAEERAAAADPVSTRAGPTSARRPPIRSYARRIPVAQTAAGAAPVGEAAPRRSLDGMRQLVMLPLAVIMLALVVTGATLAALTSAVSLTGNSFATAGTPTPSTTPTPSSSPTPSGTPSPSSSPCSGNVTIANTGPGSVNKIICSSKTTITNSNSNTVTITNTNHQSAGGGGSNANTTTNTVTIK